MHTVIVKKHFNLPLLVDKMSKTQCEVDTIYQDQSNTYETRFSIVILDIL